MGKFPYGNIKCIMTPVVTVRLLHSDLGVTLITENSPRKLKGCVNQSSQTYGGGCLMHWTTLMIMI